MNAWLPPSPNASPLASLLSVLDTLRISTATVADSAQGRLDDAATDARLTWWAHRVVAHVGATVRCQGLANRVEGHAYVLMSNHQSHFDVPVLYYALGVGIRMVAKKELFRFPVFGSAMRRAGFIEIDRADHRRAVASLDHAREALGRGTSIYLAPEGTRSETGELGRFKKGGFVLAQQTGASILPVTLRGTRDVLPAHGTVARRGLTVDVIVHPAIEVARTSADTRDSRQAREDLMNRTRAAIASAL